MSYRYRQMTNAAADFRLVYGPGAAKKIARRFGIAVVTAKLWLAGRAPSAREREIAAALLSECDRIEALIAETRQRWERLSNEPSEADSFMGRGKADRRRAPAR